MFKKDLSKGKKIFVTGGGTLSVLDKVREEDWEQLRAMIRSPNDEDKAYKG